MRQRIALFLLLTWLMTGCAKAELHPAQSIPAEPTGGDSATLDCSLYDATSFQLAFQSAAAQVEASPLPLKDARGAILPHHLLASQQIAELMLRLQQSYGNEPPRVIVLMGPNHKRVGQQAIQTCVRDWMTPFGRLRADPDEVAKVQETFGSEDHPELYREDASIMGLVPFLSKTFPDARLVPVWVGGQTTAEQSRTLGRMLGRMASEKDTLILASIDFSHGQPTGTAQKRDEETLKAINNTDVKAIERMGNDHLDAPPVLASFLLAMKDLNAEMPQLIRHANASDVLRHSVQEDTGYFTLVFQEARK